MNNFLLRTVTGIVYVAIVVLGLVFPYFTAVVFGVVTAATIWELLGLAMDRGDVKVNRPAACLAGLCLYLSMGCYTSGAVPAIAFMPYLAFIIYLFVEELYSKREDAMNDWAYTMYSQVYVALPFSMIYVLGYFSTEPNHIIYHFVGPLSVFIFLWLNDTGAYLCGSLLGRHKLFPRISPGKTWEGTVGGVVLTLIGAVALYNVTDYYGFNDLRLNLLEWMGLGLTVAVFGTWGDLVESLFKRTLGVKDSGNIIPGHGGLLDRFDSSLLALPAAVVYVYVLTLL